MQYYNLLTDSVVSFFGKKGYGLRTLIPKELRNEPWRFFMRHANKEHNRWCNSMYASSVISDLVSQHRTLFNSVSLKWANGIILPNKTECYHIGWMKFNSGAFTKHEGAYVQINIPEYNKLTDDAMVFLLAMSSMRHGPYVPTSNDPMTIFFPSLPDSFHATYERSSDHKRISDLHNKVDDMDLSQLIFNGIKLDRTIYYDAITEGKYIKTASGGNMLKWLLAPSKMKTSSRFELTSYSIPNWYVKKNTTLSKHRDIVKILGEDVGIAMYSRNTIRVIGKSMDLTIPNTEKNQSVLNRMFLAGKYIQSQAIKNEWYFNISGITNDPKASMNEKMNKELALAIAKKFNITGELKIIPGQDPLHVVAHSGWYEAKNSNGKLRLWFGRTVHELIY